MRSSGCCVAGHLTMEVPLTWQDPLALTHFSAMENDLEDVPPSPTLDPLPAPLGVAGAGFQRGFLDCAQEALRFLTEEEGMSQDNPVVMGLRQHLVQATPPHITPPTPSPCLTSTVSQRARFAPYTVPSHHRSLSAGYPRRELSKQHGVCSSSIALSGQNASSLHRCTAPSAAPSVEKLGHVLTSDLISADDLQGVLRCLGSGPSQLQTTSVSSSLSTLSSLSSSIVHHQQTSNVKGGCVVVVEGERKSDGWQRKSSSLDDSGISEMSVELDDEVDGEGRRCTSVSESVCGLDTPTSADSGCVSVLDSPGLALTPDNGVGDSVGKCSASRFSFENLPTDACTHSPDNPPISAASPYTTDAPVHSNPSSQLALLSSLSSGTHRLTSPAAAEDNNSGDATAGRIQSLASQILLLLQEEAEALDYSDDDDEDDEDDDDDHEDQLDSELGEFDVEGDSWNLEAEP